MLGLRLLHFKIAHDASHRIVHAFRPLQGLMNQKQIYQIATEQGGLYLYKDRQYQAHKYVKQSLFLRFVATSAAA